MSGLVHHNGAQCMEASGRQLFSEHIRHVVISSHIWHGQFHGFDHIANVKMTSGDVFATTMVLGVVGEIPSPLIVRGAGRGPLRSDAQACK